MENYEVIITPDAEDDLVELKRYIAEKLLAPDTARNYIRTLREKIGNLSYLAPSLPLVDDEPWRSRKIHKDVVKNFIIYYRIDEDTKLVYVLNVIYTKRDQLRALRDMKNIE